MMPEQESTEFNPELVADDYIEYIRVSLRQLDSLKMAVSDTMPNAAKEIGYLLQSMRQNLKGLAKVLPKEEFDLDV